MHFFCKLLPPRPTFVADMTPAEGQLMQRHAAHWQAGISAGGVVVFGFVGDPAGPFGMGVVEFDGEAGARAFTDADPVIRSGQGFRWEIHPMPLGATGR